MLFGAMRGSDLRYLCDRLPSTHQYDRMLAATRVCLDRQGWEISKEDLADAIVWAEDMLVLERRNKS